MDGTARIHGLKDAMRAMQAAFPRNPEQQRRLLNQSMRASASQSFLPIAKSLALQGDGSGSLSEALGIRNQRRGRVASKGVTAGVEITPVRFNRKAIALYIHHYYTGRGKTAPASIVTSGIRHGHLVEFGTVHSSAKPYLWPAAQSGLAKYRGAFASDLSKKTEAAVRRAARKARR